MVRMRITDGKGLRQTLSRVFGAWVLGASVLALASGCTIRIYGLQSGLDASASAAAALQGWQHQLGLSPDVKVSGSVYGGLARMNTSGQTVMIWSQTRGNAACLYKAERAANGTWTFPADVHETFSIPGTDPQNLLLEMNDAGQAVALWTQNPGNSFDRLYKAERAADGTWTRPSGFDDYVAGTEGIQAASLQLNDAGQAFITWIAYDGTGQRLYKAERAANGAWTLPAGVNDFIGFSSSDVTSFQAVMNQSGQVVLLWEQYDGYLNQLYRAERAPNGAWTFPASLGDPLSFGGGVAGRKVVLNDAGQAIIIWMEYDNGAFKGVFKAERAANGAWTLPANDADRLFPSVWHLYFGDLVLNESGQAVLTWTFNNVAEYRLYKAERAVNGSWTVPADINDYISFSGWDGYIHRILLNGLGQAACWPGGRMTGARIKFTRRSARRTERGVFPRVSATRFLFPGRMPSWVRSH